jgi:hypothetical protein
MVVSTTGRQYRYTALGALTGGILTAVLIVAFFVTEYQPLVFMVGLPLVIGLILGALLDRKTDPALNPRAGNAGKR